jgi:hypothetical protein
VVVGIERGSLVASYDFAKRGGSSVAAGPGCYNQGNVAAKIPETREVIWPFDEQIKASGLLRVRDYGNATLLCRRSQMRMPFLLLALTLLAIFIFLAYYAAIQRPWT